MAIGYGVLDDAHVDWQRVFAPPERTTRACMPAEQLLRETEAEILRAMRTLAEISADAVHVSDGTRARYSAAIGTWCRPRGDSISCAR